MQSRNLLLYLTAALWALPSVAAPVDRHGVLLAATCAACHGTNGNSVDGTPVLAGLDPHYFSAQMHAFQRNERASTVMHHLSKNFTAPEIEQMADFFANQARTAPQAPDFAAVQNSPAD